MITPITIMLYQWAYLNRLLTNVVQSSQLGKPSNPIYKGGKVTMIHSVT